MSLGEVVERQQQEVFALVRSRVRLSRYFIALLFVDVLLCASWLMWEHYLPRGGP